MIDMSLTIAPKSDQLTADHLRPGPLTIRVTGVSADMSNPDQPVAVDYEGSEGKPFKPCKTMRRMMMYAWGQDASAYVGKSLTVYCDPNVRFGADTPGGVRISHMSHIDGPLTKALLSTKGKYKQYTVKPLETPRAEPTGPTPEDKAAAWLASYQSDVAATHTLDELRAVQEAAGKALTKMERQFPELHMQAAKAGSLRVAELIKAERSDGAGDDGDPAFPEVA